MKLKQVPGKSRGICENPILFHQDQDFGVLFVVTMLISNVCQDRILFRLTKSTWFQVDMVCLIIHLM